jgi:hypothetical protein
VGQDNSWGAVDGDLKPGTCAFLRPCTNAREGNVFIYAQAGTSQSGRALIEYYEHSTVEEI